MPETISAAVFLLGPPGVGKSTLSGQLVARHGAGVFRLREYVQQRALGDPALAVEIRNSADRLGWLPDRMVLPLVRDAVAGPFHPTGRFLLFEGYPGNGIQAATLTRQLRRLDARPAALVLQLPPAVARLRALERRVCPRCTPEVGESHRPAWLDPTGRCAGCGGIPVARSGDSPDRLAARTARFHQRTPQILRVLSAQRVPWHVLDANQPPDRLLAAVESKFYTHLPKETR